MSCKSITIMFLKAYLPSLLCFLKAYQGEKHHTLSEKHCLYVQHYYKQKKNILLKTENLQYIIISMK